MRWLNGTDEIKATGEVKGGVVRFTVVIKLMPWENRRTYSCRTFFEHSLYGTVDRSDDPPVNNGAFSDVCEMPALAVKCEYIFLHADVTLSY